MHLDRFAGQEPRGQVWTYDLSLKKHWSQIPEGTGKQTHFYSFRRPDGEIDTSVEAAISKFETRAKGGYDRLIAGETLSAAQRQYFAEFVALMYARTPTMRRVSAELASQILQVHQYGYAINPKAFEGLMRRYEEETGRNLSAEQKEYIRQTFLDPAKHYKIHMPQEVTLNALSITDNLAPIFFSMSWTVLVPKSGFFVTSDNPVVRMVDSQTRHPVFGDRGFENRTAQVTFPLSPKAILLMTWEKEVRQRSFLPRDAVWNMNRARAVHAERFIFAHINHKYVAQLGNYYSAIRQKVRLHGFGPKSYSQVELERLRPK